MTGRLDLTRPGWWWSWVALWCLAGPARAASVDAAGLEEFRLVEERFRSRMEELLADTRQFLSDQERYEKDRLTEAYDALQRSVEAQELEQRGVAIERLEGFLVRFPDVPYASHVRFRLADLYFERSSSEYLKAARAYFLASESDDLEALASLGAEPKLDLSPSIRLYERIIADNLKLPPEERYERVDGAFLMLAFCFSDETSQQRDEAKAKGVFEQMIEHLPGTDYADRAHLYLGNYAFNQGDYLGSIAAYNRVLGRGEEGAYYDQALYKLAWARYKMSDYDVGMPLFVDLLDLSQRSLASSGRESSFAPDGRRYLALSIFDVSNKDASDPVEVADALFRKVGSREYERDIYIELADVLMKYAYPQQALRVYERLQDDPRWVNEPDNPVWQEAVIKLYGTNFLVRDLERAGSERIEYLERYGEGSAWWQANRTDPDAQATVRRYIEGTRREVANEYFVRADESGDPQAYALAAAKFAEYLRFSPIADDYYEHQYYLAVTLARSGQLEEAMKEYQSLLGSAKDHVYEDGAAYGVMEASYQRTLQLSGPLGEVPANRTVERTYEPTPGKTIEVFQTAPDRLQFVQAVDQLMAHSFEPDPHPDMLPFQTATEERRPKLMYAAAQTLYLDNQFEAARPRLLQIIEQFPRTDEASFAATYILNSYLDEGNLAEVRKWSLDFATRSLGATGAVPEFITDSLEDSTFQLAYQQGERGDLAGAVESYLAFKRDFPKSDRAPDALFNAAVYLEQLGRLEEANRLYEQFVDEYPTNARTNRLLFRMALNYESTFDLGRAVAYYDRLVATFPDSDDAADALYNASFLRLGTQEYAAAAKGFESYAERYPDKVDREQVAFKAGEAWEQTGDDAGIEFYRRYLKQYSGVSADRSLSAHSRLVELHRKKGDTRGADRELAALLATYGALRRASATIGPEGHAAAAAAAFPALESSFTRLSAEKLSGNEGRDADLLEDKQKELVTFGAEVDAYNADHADFTYATGSLLLKARAVLYLADLGLGLQPPTSWTEEEQIAYLEVLEAEIYPIYEKFEEEGIKRLKDVVDFAARQKRHSPFVDQALAELNQRRPEENPAFKRELVGKAETVALPAPLPMDAAAPAEEAKP